MATFTRQVPKIDLRTRDNTPGKFPSVARTGTPGRLGNNTRFFDDRNTIVFTASGSTTTVSYPTTLQTSNQYLSSTLQSNITAPGQTTKAINQWLNLPTQVETFSAFNENKLFEQDIKNTQFYKTGSDISIVGDGFSYNLGSKTQLRISVPIATSTRFNATSASIYYLNWTGGRFEEVGSAYKHRTVANLGFWESRLFSPLGSSIVSTSKGSTLNLVGDSAGAAFGPTETSTLNVSYVSTMLGQTLQTFSTQSVLIDSRFAATGSQCLPLSSLITQPFALEKMVIEFPWSSGPGWHGDITNFVRLAAASGGAYRSDPFDAGGPCITMGLINQTSDNTRDLILSATVIPSSDNISGATVSPLYNERFAAGFLSFATPGAVVTPGSNNQFTGTIRLTIEPQISNGVTSLGFGTPPGGYPANNGKSFRNSFSLAVNPYGRGMKGKQSGRSLFGKEYATPTEDPPSTLASKFPSNSYNDVYLFNYEKGITSPYVLFPGDNLILCFAKYRGCATGSNLTAYNYGNSMTINQHDVGINVGAVDITLYGSTIRSGKEIHDPLNSRLDTLSVQEVIGSETITDEFDVNYYENLTGSIYTLTMSGSIFTTGSFFASGVGTSTQSISSSLRARGVWIDSTTGVDNRAKHNDSPYFSVREKLLWPYSQVQRNAQFVSEKDRYYDSMLPRIDEIMLRDGAQMQQNTVPGYQYYMSFDMKTGAGDDTEWTKSYPFAPEYNGLVRNDTIDKVLPYKPGTTTPADFYAQFANRGAIFVSDLRASNGINGFNTHFEWLADSTGLANPAGLNYEDLIKLLYGIGDKNNCRYASGDQIHETQGMLYGSTTNVLGRTKYIFSSTLDLYFGAEIRGWKYGIINGLPFKTKCVWRRNKFGQIRDMLEQRLDSKFYDGSSVLSSPIQIKFLAKDGTQILPEKTFSSNLHFEASSSLPYFDGQVRNRENPLELDKLYNFRFTE